jgi:Tol biopolymer transport system component
MALSRGSRLGPYEIVSALGAGGMGEVYRARDTRLGRDVAVKVLPPAFSADRDRLRRFEQEARSAGQLNHPNVLAIYDVGTHGGSPYVVAELLEGETLRDAVAGGPIPLRKAIDYARQTAEGLAAAHEKGIVHRDLKPENLFLTRDGRVKILDFGLAKLTHPDPVSEPGAAATTGPSETESGALMGTVGYMSPEQLRGKRVDYRSDIFAFGAILYELLSGRRAFHGDSVPETMNAILKDDPPELSESGRSIPPALARVVGHCLEKVPERRFHSLRDVVFALQEVEQPSGPGAVQPAVGKARGSRLVGGIALAAAVALAVAGATWWLMRPRKTESVPAPAITLTRLTSDHGLTTDAALSPDGRLLACASDRSGEGNLDIYVRQVGGGEPLRLTRDPADDWGPAFSPDGTTIAFRSERDGGGIYVVSALGGPARCIAPEPQGQRPQFSPDGNWIAYTVGGLGGASLSVRNSARIYMVAAAGGVPRQVQPDFVATAFPVWSPDGTHLLFLGNRDEKLPMEDSIDWWVTPLDSGPAIKSGALEATRQAKLTGPLGVYPWALFAPTWQPQGNSLVFSAQSGDTTNLWRIGISPETWKVTGPPQRLTSGTMIERGPSAAFGPGGVVRVAFANLTQNLALWSLPIEPNQGRVTGELKRLTQEAADDSFPALSRDGSKMVWVSSRTGSQEIWIRALPSGEESALTATRSTKWCPAVSPDGSRVSYSESRSWNVYIVPSAGGPPEMVCEGCGQATGWSPDGKRIIGNPVNGQAWVLDLVSRRKTALLATRHWIATGQFSPDGRWFSFLAGEGTSLAGEGTSWGTIVAPFQGEGPIGESAWVAIMKEGGTGNWSSDGKSLYMISGRDGFACIWAQRLDPATKRPVGAPFAVFHSHNPRVSLYNATDLALAIGPDRMLFHMGEHTGNIWMAEWKPQ